MGGYSFWKSLPYPRGIRVNELLLGFLLLLFHRGVSAKSSEGKRENSLSSLPHRGWGGPERLRLCRGHRETEAGTQGSGVGGGPGERPPLLRPRFLLLRSLGTNPLALPARAWGWGRGCQADSSRKKPSASHILRTHGFCPDPSKPETSTSSEVSMELCLKKAEPARPHPGSSPERQRLPRPWPPPPSSRVPSVRCSGMDGGGQKGGFPESKSRTCQQVVVSRCKDPQAKHTAPVPARDSVGWGRVARAGPRRTAGP